MEGWLCLVGNLSGAIFDLYACHIQGHLSQHTQPHRSDQKVCKFEQVTINPLSDKHLILLRATILLSSDCRYLTLKFRKPLLGKSLIHAAVFISVLSNTGCGPHLLIHVYHVICVYVLLLYMMPDALWILNRETSKSISKLCSLVQQRFDSEAESTKHRMLLSFFNWLPPTLERQCGRL